MDTARDGAGRLIVIEHANRQSCCLQLDSGRSLDQIIRDFVIVEFIASRRIGELSKESKEQPRRRSASYKAQEVSAEASTMGLALTGMILRADTGCYLSHQSPMRVGRERVCAFENGSSELCCLCENKQKRGNSNKLNIMIKHMRVTDRGNEISSDSSPDRGRDTMMPVIVKGIVSDRTLGGLGVSTQRYFECIWHIVPPRGSSSAEVHRVKFIE